MALSWKESAILPFDDLQPALEAISTVSATMQTALSAVRAAVTAVPAIVDATALAADLASGALASSLVGLIADALDTGIYTIVIYPQRVDYSRALIRELLVTARTTVATLAAKDEKGTAAFRAKGAREAVPESLRAVRQQLEAQRTELADLERQDRFAACDLRVDHPFETFMQTLTTSTQDLGDLQRPQFSTTSICAGAVVTVGADTLVELKRVIDFMAKWLGHRGMAREAAMLDRLANVTAWRNRVGLSQSPPDWMRLSVAKALGLDAQVKALRDAAGALGASNIVSGSAAADAVRGYVADTIAALDEAATVQQTLLAGITAVAELAAARASVLLVPPVDGERVVAGVTIPNLTAGVDGFMAAVRAASSAPSNTWVAGVAMLVGAPVGLDVTNMTAEVANGTAVTTAIGTARSVYDTLRGAIPA